VNERRTYIFRGLFLAFFPLFFFTFLPLLLLALSEVERVRPWPNAGDQTLPTNLFFFLFEFLPHLPFFDNPAHERKIVS
jgi:hypothetical protein